MLNLATVVLGGLGSDLRRYFEPLTAALSYLHVTCGLVHHDLKSRNILIMHDGVLKLCDLSFAAFISDSRYFEQAGQRLAIAPGRFFNFSGTWQYHAPEMLDISDSIDKATGFPITRMAR